jgi:hypothetical protein
MLRGCNRLIGAIVVGRVGFADCAVGKYKWLSG